MDIRAVDPHDEALFHEYYLASERAQRHGREYPTFWSEPEVLAMFRAEPEEERIEPFAAFEGDEIVGTGVLFFPLLANTHMAFTELDTVPERRREGVGSALVDHVLTRVAAAGRTLVMVQAILPIGAGDGHPVKRFAAKHRFSLGNEELRRLLQLPIDEDVIQGWIDECAPHHVDYRIEQYVDDGVPEHLLPSYVHTLNQLAADAPTGEIEFEAEATTVEIYQHNVAQGMGAGRQVFRTLAVTTGPDGLDEVVAHTQLACPPEGADPPYGYQWGTLVLQGHRGHRLGLAMKAVNLRAFQVAHPERTMITTQNSPVNGPMVSINERIGFRPVEVGAEYVRQL
ncbi:MAG: GNAT family N-acetyltransferase [Nocardioidaceae bacterium]